LPEAENAPGARYRDEPDFARLARLEAYGGAGGDIEAHAARPLPLLRDHNFSWRRFHCNDPARVPL